ncbi:MAG: sigma-70 family RNA polymerase sigma factor [Planctomycetota bacterium]
MEISDETIDALHDAVIAAGDGNRDSFDRLLIRFEARFTAIVRRMLRDFPRLQRWEQTDDVFQTSMIRLHQSISSAQPRNVREFVGLAATQIRRTLLDMIRHYYGALGVGENYQTEGGGRAADDAGGAVAQAHNAAGTEPLTLQDWSAFHEAVEKLPEDLREVFELAWYVQLKQDEIATTLQISRRTVIRRIQSARLQLSDTLMESP